MKQKKFLYAIFSLMVLSQTLLADNYEEGLIAEKYGDHSLAQYHQNLACEEDGHIMACYKAGMRMLKWKGFGSAAEYFQKACDGKNAESCSRLGNLYETGTGVKLDYSKALKLYKQACALKYQEGCSNATKLEQEIKKKGLLSDSTNSKELLSDSTNSKELLSDFTNSIGMVLKEIPAGSVYSKSTQKHVPLKSFYISQTEVTQAHWIKIMGTNPSFFQSKTENLPVDSIDLKSALEFVNRLNQKENTKAYRLLTADEFKYLTHDMCESADRGNASSFSQFHNYDCVANSIVYNQLIPNSVKSKQANKFGVFDMLGNVNELTYNCKGDKCTPSVMGGSWAYKSLWDILEYDTLMTPGRYFERLYISQVNQGFNQKALIDLGFHIVKSK